MKYRAAVTNVLFVAFLCSSAIAGPVDLSKVSTESKWALHVDVEGLLASDLGRFLLDQAKSKGDLSQLDELMSTIGFDPLKDLAGVTLWGRSYEPDAGVLIVKGRFNADKLLSLIEEQKLGTFDYKGKLVHHWVNKPNEKQSYGVFWADDVIVVSESRSALEFALDTFSENAATGAALPGVTKLFTDSFVVIAAKDLQSATGAQAASLQNISSLLVRVGETQGNLFIKANVGAISETDGEELRQLASGMLAFAKMSTRHSQDKGAKELASLLDSVKIGGKGANIELEVEIPVEELVKLAGFAQEAIKLDIELK